jgi:hypothetical protein
VTTSLLLNVDVLNTELLPKTLEPLIFHWYKGADPPFKAFAVNTTEDPAQIVVVDAVIATVGVTL